MVNTVPVLVPILVNTSKTDTITNGVIRIYLNGSNQMLAQAKCSLPFLVTLAGLFYLSASISSGLTHTHTPIHTYTQKLHGKS